MWQDTLVLARIAAALLWAQRRKHRAGTSYREILARLESLTREVYTVPSSVAQCGDRSSVPTERFTRRELRARW